MKRRSQLGKICVWKDKNETEIWCFIMLCYPNGEKKGRRRHGFKCKGSNPKLYLLFLIGWGSVVMRMSLKWASLITHSHIVHILLLRRINVVFSFFLFWKFSILNTTNNIFVWIFFPFFLPWHEKKVEINGRDK